MHQKLLNELRNIKNINGLHIAKKLFLLIENEEYSQALLVACQHCKANNKALFHFIETLLRYRNYLPIEVNTLSPATHKSPIWYAVDNRNNELFDLLDRGGANADYKESGQPSAREIHLENTSAERTALALHLDVEFFRHKKELDLLYAKLPAKEDISCESANEAHDIDRLDYIIKRINYLLSYFRNMNKGNLLPVDITLDSLQKKNLYEASIYLSCRGLVELCSTIRNLSGALRSKYSKHFAPQPFSWFTFEQLGGILARTTSANMVFSLPIRAQHLNVSATLKRQEIVSHKGVAERFHSEFFDSKIIIGQAVPTIINSDLLKLKSFFEQMLALETGKSITPVASVCLYGIKALTSRFMDNQNIMKVLHLVHYSDNEPGFIDRSHCIKGGLLRIGPLLNTGEEYKQRFDLTRMSGRHAALRRLQMLGELFTGKNFSSSLFDLDPTIDWRAFITIRDAITHQDERDHKYKIDALLADGERLQRIMGIEFSDFGFRMDQLLDLREQKEGRYEWDPKKHWENILKAHISKSMEVSKTQLRLNTVERRASETDEAVIVEALKNREAPVEIIERFKGILNGTEAIPNQKELGALQLHFPPRKENREQFNKLAGIMSKAISKQRPEKERNAKRNAVMEQAKQRELEREAKFKGLEFLRDLAKDLNSEPLREHMMTPEKQVNAAIEALNNLHVFLREAGYLVADEGYTTMEEWDAFHYGKGPSLVHLLASNHELSDALEYNAGQLLQHLDTIREFKGAGFSKYLGHQYESLRALRNYIEHGDPLVDTPNKDHSLIYDLDIKRLRQQRIAPVIMSLIFELPKDLEMIKKTMHSVAETIPACGEKGKEKGKEKEKEKGKEKEKEKGKEKENEAETTQDRTYGETNRAYNPDGFFSSSPPRDNSELAQNEHLVMYQSKNH